MSKEELRVSNPAKKLVNQNGLKSSTNRQRKRVTIQSLPSNEYLSVVQPKLSPINDESIINICLNLHRSTYNWKSSAEFDVN